MYNYVERKPCRELEKGGVRAKRTPGTEVQMYWVGP
jgi:hypothetical protein